MKLLRSLFEVRDNGKPRRVAYVGGTAIPSTNRRVLRPLHRFIQEVGDAADDYGATVLLSNHTEFDNAYYRANLAASRKPGESNPFNVGEDGAADCFTVVQACASAAKLRATGQ